MIDKEKGPFYPVRWVRESYQDIRIVGPLIVGFKRDPGANGCRITYLTN